VAEAPAAGTPPVFQERPRERVVPDAWGLAAVPAALCLLSAGLGAPLLAALCLGLALFTVAFFRNPERAIPGDERSALAPADGRVIEVGLIEEPDGGKALRIGIFLSVFDVHVNRMPLAGRVEAVERAGSRYRAAFDRRAEGDNVRCTLRLRTAGGVPFRVVQITGLIARRIVCHPGVGDWVGRGVRFGLIRFGSRTDLVLPADAKPRVRPGERVRGGRTILAVLPGGEG
jgi:phosphatidylserine decarboxylase